MNSTELLRDSLQELVIFCCIRNDMKFLISGERADTNKCKYSNAILRAPAVSSDFSDIGGRFDR